MKNDLRSQAVSGVKWSGVSMLGGTLLHFLTLAVLARLLMPSDFGIMGMILVIVGFSQAFADMGLSNAIIQRQNVTEKHLSCFFWINIFIGILLFGVVLLTRSLAAAYFREPDLSSYLVYASFIFLITPFGQVFQTLLKKDMQFKSLTKVEILGALIYSISSISLAVAGYGVLSLILGQLCRSFFTVIFLVILFKNKWMPKFYFSFKEINSYMSFGTFQLGERLINYFRTNIDYIIIGRILGPATLGYYSLAYQIMVFPLTKINPIFTRVAFPAFSKIQDDNQRIRRGYSKVINLISLLSFSMLTGMFIVAPEFIRVFYGAKWEPAIIILQIFCLLGAFISLGNPLGSVLLAKGRADIGFYWNIFSVIRVSLAVFIGIKWGVTGIATAILISQIPFFFILQAIVNRLIGLKFKQFFNAVKLPFICSILMFASLYLIKLALSHKGLHVTWLLGILVTSGIAIYSGAYYLMDRKFLKDLLSLLKESG